MGKILNDPGKSQFRAIEKSDPERDMWWNPFIAYDCELNDKQAGAILNYGKGQNWLE